MKKSRLVILTLYIGFIFSSPNVFGESCNSEEYCEKNLKSESIARFLFQRAEVDGLNSPKLQVGDAELDTLKWVSEKIPEAFCDQGKKLLKSIVSGFQEHSVGLSTNELFEESRYSVLLSSRNSRVKNGKSRFCQRFKLVQVGYRDLSIEGALEYQSEATFVEP